MKISRTVVTVLTLAALFLMTGCQSVYYAAWEKLGKEKRHLLKDQVKEVRSEQQEASEEFKDVLSRIKELYGFEGGDLEEFYEDLKSDYEDSLERSEKVSERIDEVEEIAEDLFKEWEREIEEIDNAKFKSQSRASLQETRRRYERLHRSMIQAEQSMEPVLNKLEDYVLYLKHNLNAQAIGTIRQEVADIEVEVSSLIRDINRSIREADEFLKDF
jgi:ElaB/YqjD/DUF883 family membrane-anchored ribosome-binding protein